ncbi:MAG: glycoside hydrolase family 3 C-terminal domain-containing protein, partial [Prolixibacteraceae bacterium]|nr:glycoside hydrolase family 3 C-terminal domain-containing protein [Prolixibacteraceae bacterium]
GFEGGDRTHLKLPSTQLELMEKMKETGKPVILVLMNGSALALNWEYENLNAIISAGYPGEQGGNAVADVLFGDYNPAGRLPVTYYKSVEQLPPFEDYDMEGRTYRYFSGEPLFPFGFGLSYTTFVYSDLIIPEKVNSGEVTDITVKVKNTGDKDGEEVVQLYITDEKASTPRPIRQLEGFKRVFLKAGEIKEVKFQIQPRQLSMIDKNEKRLIEPGWFSVSVGGKQPGFSGVSDAFTTGVITSRFKVSGKSPEFDL